MKFIHAADIHLDSPLRGLARYSGAPIEQMQTATRRAFINLIDFACEQQVDFVLIAGDLYDGDWKDYNTGLFFHQQMLRLRDADIPAFIVLGNHDAGNVMTKQLRLPDNVYEFSSQAAETHYLDQLGVAIHGHSFPKKAVTQNLVTAYPAARSDYYNIGMLHTALNGREGHAHYAPCNLTDLLAHHYDYWALGHIHQREILNETPYIVFSGNIQGRHAKETGAKGCTLVTVDNGQTQLQHSAIDVLRWLVCDSDVSQHEHAEDVVDSVREAALHLMPSAEGKPIALRVNVYGTCPAHAVLHRNPERWSNEIRAAVTDVGNGQVWVEKIALNTHAPQHFSNQEDGPLAELMSTLRNLPQDVRELAELSAELKSLKQALPIEARDDERHELDPDNPETIRSVLGGVEALLMARLRGV